MIARPPISPLFPYPTLFRSGYFGRRSRQSHAWRCDGGVGSRRQLETVNGFLPSGGSLEWTNDARRRGLACQLARSTYSLEKPAHGFFQGIYVDAALRRLGSGGHVSAAV